MAALCALAALHAAGPRIARGPAGYRFEWRLWSWYIEDAAISFAYARNLWNGDGLVANIGGERVEGYSNPLWVALMALEYPVMDPFWSSKVMGLALAALTTWLTWRIAERALPERSAGTALVAPIVLAANAQFAIWNASGLENPLFNFLLALGIYRTLIEDERRLFPWSALVWFGMAITRPEAIAYSAWAGFWAMVFAWRAGRGLKPTLQWLAVFFTPFTIYQTWRYQYFGWAFPNTYYAKLGERNIRIWNWGSGGWKYVRNWANELGAGYFFPMYLTGLIGLSDRRRTIALIATVAVLAGILGYPEQFGRIATATGYPQEDVDRMFVAGDTYMMVRFGVLSLCAVIVPLATLGTPGWKAKILVYGPALIAMSFAVRSGGDWMKGYRWMSFVSVPSAVIWAAAVAEVAEMGQRWLSRIRAENGEWSVAGWMSATVVTAMLIPPNLAHTAWFMGPRETSPQMVKERVAYTANVQRRLFLDEARNFDVDMGAHMYWSEHEMVDIAGLVDVSMARHRFEMPFIREYVFKEKRPEFAHVHGGWATQSRVPQHVEWKRDYIEIPGYPTGKQLHPGNFIRRELVMDASWQGTAGRMIDFEGGVRLEGWEVPSPEVSHAKSWFVELGVSMAKPEEASGARVLGFLSDDRGNVLTFDLPLGYDWLPVEKWRTQEVFHGRFAPLLPQELPEGVYDLGFVVFGNDGAVLQPTSAPSGFVVGGREGISPARVAVGEVRFPGVLTIGADGTGETAAQADLTAALASAGSGDCAAAEASWALARRHLPKAASWHEEKHATLALPFSDCWVRKAQSEAEQERKVAAFERALRWGKRHQPAWDAAAAYSDELYQRGLASRDGAAWEDAYAQFRDAVRVLPTNSWARRYAEEARDERLGLQGDAADDAEAARKAAAEARKKRAEAKPAKKAPGADTDRAAAGGGEAEGDDQEEEAP